MGRRIVDNVTAEPQTPETRGQTETAAPRTPRRASQQREVSSAVAKNVPGRKLAIAAARSALDDKCEDIVVLDLRGVSPVCDYFVIATGTSDRQMRAVGD